MRLMSNETIIDIAGNGVVNLPTTCLDAVNFHPRDTRTAFWVKDQDYIILSRRAAGKQGLDK